MSVELKSQQEVETLVSSIEGFLYSQVFKRFKAEHGCFSFDDMLQTARLAAVKAAHSYSPETGYKFITWAGVHVKAALSALYRQAAVCSISSRDYEEGLPKEERAALIWRKGVYLSTVAKTTNSGRQMELGDMLDDKDPGVHDSVVAAMENKLLQQLVAALPSSHRDVIIKFYGLGGVEPMSPTDIGVSRGNVSRQRIHQLHTMGLSKLRRQAKKMGLFRRH